jgi:hypothetical protein
MSSTPSAYPQVDRGHFASFRVVKCSISAIQADFCDRFDSRQLHESKLVRAKSLGQLSFSSTSHQHRSSKLTPWRRSGLVRAGTAAPLCRCLPARRQAVFDPTRFRVQRVVPNSASRARITAGMVVASASTASRFFLHCVPIQPGDSGFTCRCAGVHCGAGHGEPARGGGEDLVAGSPSRPSCVQP